MDYNRCRAKSRYVIKTFKSTTWKDLSFQSTNINQDLCKVWEKINKIHGKSSGHKNPMLTVDDEIVSCSAEVGNIQADSFSRISSGHGCPSFEKIVNIRFVWYLEKNKVISNY